MSELKALLAFSLRLESQSERFVSATVVGTQGSAYRRPGARMVIAESGETAGSVSGGCLEADLARTCLFRTRDRDAVVVSYDSTIEESDRGWGAGLGCNGVVDVLIERGDARGARAGLEFLRACVLGERRGALVTAFRSSSADVRIGSRLLVDEEGPAVHVESPALVALEERARRVLVDRRMETFVLEVSGGRADVLIEPVEPPPRLFVCGSGPDALPVARLADALGWNVVVWPARRHDAAARFAGVAAIGSGAPEDLRDAIDRSVTPLAIVMSHDFERDRDLLAALLTSKARYIGVLGPRRRTEKLLAEISPPVSACLERVHAPVGLDLGAESPDEVALSAIAEMQAVLSGSSAQRLRERRAPIHAARVPAVREVVPLDHDEALLAGGAQ